jgi:hypothetical protein
MPPRMHDLPEVEQARAERDRGEQAQHVVRRLVDAGALKLKNGTRVREMGRKLARAWRLDEDTARGEALCAWLHEREEVDEVTASAWEIAKIAEEDAP